jgi:para-nitrobenzyl esterase
VSEGRLGGEERDGIRVFRGIPFAAPPVGELRFAPPRPPTPWSGLRRADRDADPAPQPSVGPSVGKLSEAPIVGQEDCLYLNVYAPADPGIYPVIVWIHGGGGTVGSPREHDPVELARSGVVVVTFAYRLGALGLLFLPDVFQEEADCNFALLDQVAAPCWVATNIGAFGGDPGRVTLAGQSAGGRGVGNLIATPDARGLFSKAFVMSATGIGELVSGREDAEQTTTRLLRQLGLDWATAARLRGLSATEIVGAQSRVWEEGSSLLAFQAVVDGVTLPVPPIEAISGGSFSDREMVIGTTHDEYDLFAANPAVAGLGKPMTVPSEVFDRALEGYRQRPGAPATESELHNQVLTAADWWMPAIRLAEAQVNSGGRAWMYRLDWRIAPVGQGIGAPHGLDVGVVGPPHPAIKALLEPSGRDPESYASMLGDLRSALARFAGGAAPRSDWPVYDLTSRPTFVFDDASQVCMDPDRELRESWAASWSSSEWV